VLSCAEDNISEHFWLFAAGEPLFPSKVWEKACTALLSVRIITSREDFPDNDRRTS